MRLIFTSAPSSIFPYNVSRQSRICPSLEICHYLSQTALAVMMQAELDWIASRLLALFLRNPENIAIWITFLFVPEMTTARMRDAGSCHRVPTNKARPMHQLCQERLHLEKDLRPFLVPSADMSPPEEVAMGHPEFDFLYRTYRNFDAEGRCEELIRYRSNGTGDAKGKSSNFV